MLLARWGNNASYFNQGLCDGRPPGIDMLKSFLHTILPERLF
jgi:hypothetical protein